jgi:hypothetical protein
MARERSWPMLPCRHLQLFPLLVLGLVGFLLLPPALAGARQTAGQTVCENNLKQIAIATINAADTNNSLLPPLAGIYPDENSFGTVFFHILPYIEQDHIYKKSAESVGDRQQYNIWVNETLGKHIELYECPEDKTNPGKEPYQGWLAPGSYAANFLVFGLVDEAGNPLSLQGKSRFPASITDGTSNTIFFAERYQICNGAPNAWGYYGDYSWSPRFAYGTKARFQITPAPADCDASVPQTVHAAGMNAGLGDGSVRLLSAKLSSATWWHACTPNGGESLGADW